MKGVPKDEVTMGSMSRLLDLADTSLLVHPNESDVEAYEPNNIKGCEIVPRHNVNFIDIRILNLFFQP